MYLVMKAEAMQLRFNENFVKDKSAHRASRTTTLFHIGDAYIHECEPVADMFPHMFRKLAKDPIHSLEAAPVVGPVHISRGALIHIEDHMPLWADGAFPKRAEQ